MRLPPLRLATSTTIAGCLGLLLGAAPAGASPSATSLLSNAIAATDAATSVHIVLSSVQNKEKDSFNVQATNTGVGEGTFSEGSQSFTMRSVGGTVYLMANTAFWDANGGKSAAQLFVGRWVSTAATSSTGSQVVGLVNSTTLLKQLFTQSGISGSHLSSEGKATVGGQSATVIGGHDKSGAGKIYIASSGKPYILKVVFSGKGTSGSIALSAYGQPVSPAVPQNAIDMDTLSS